MHIISDDDLSDKKRYFDKQFRDNTNDIQGIHPLAVYENSKEIEYYLADPNNSEVQSFLENIRSDGMRDKLLQKDKISVFCYFDCAALLDCFNGLDQYSIHLTYFRKTPFKTESHHTDGSKTMQTLTGYDQAMFDSIRQKLDRDFFIPFERSYGRALMEEQKKDLNELVLESLNTYVVKNREVIGFMASLPYHDEKLSFKYYLICFVWLDQKALNKDEKRYVSVQLFKQLRNEEPPFGAAVNIENARSRRYFEKNEFVPYWIRINRK